jgi:hypothetical protein
MQGQHAGEIRPVNMVSDGLKLICGDKIPFDKNAEEIATAQ